MGAMSQTWNKADVALISSALFFLLALYLHLHVPSAIWTDGLLMVSEAALVGGVADWFAVTALFRRPLGFPYHTAILPRRRDSFIHAIVVMVQKEVALRMVAKPGTKDYGALSVAVQYYTKPDIVLDVPPKSFLPAPAVTSSVIRCVLRDKPPVDVIDERLFFRVVKAGFAQRRKTFANTMKTTGLSKDRIEELLAKANIDGQRRGETFTLQEFADVANAWAALIK